MKKSFVVFAAIMSGVLAFAACGGKEGNLKKKQCAKVFGEVASVLLEGEPSKPCNYRGAPCLSRSGGLRQCQRDGSVRLFCGRGLKKR